MTLVEIEGGYNTVLAELTTIAATATRIEAVIEVIKGKWIVLYT